MRILYFHRDGRLFPGILTDFGVIDLCKLSNHFNQRQPVDAPMSNEDLTQLRLVLEHAAGNTIPVLNESELTIGPCVPRPSKIICIGLNYRKHAEESNMPIPAVPVAFTKYSNTLIDFGQPVTLGMEGEQFDYEVELGVVIGRKCKNVPAGEALHYVFGYCTANDLSCRDLQFKTSQWLIGKSLDGFLPLGKCVVTADEIPDPQKLQLSCQLNGEERQNSNTADMIFPVATIIAFLSRYMTLEPGDLILTGTPAGVIMGLPEKNWLKPGDKVKVEIEKLGYSENTMR